MINHKVKTEGYNKYYGFSLLEIIFVLAFLGIILLAVGNYARKLIDERARQTAADAVAQDVYGALQFINAGSITATVNNVTKKIINPLYQQPADPISEDPADINTLGIQKNPLWLAHPASSAEASSQSVSPYIARSWSKSVTTPVSNGLQVTDPDTGTTYYSHSLKWSRAVWGPDSVRGYFTDSACAGASGHVYFNQQFLSCDENPVLRGSEIAISRIDLVSDKGTVSRPAGATTAVPVGIDRVDVYISFSPVDNNPARIEQFITPLMTAFRLKKITPNANAIYLVRQQTPAASNAWTLLDKTTGQPATPTTPDVNLAHFSDLPDMIDKLQHGQTYAIRFSFDGKGDYLRTDGLNSADKVCWNTTTGAAGPCLTSPAQDALVLKQRQNIHEFANLQVGDVVSRGNRLLADGTTAEEYYTSPQISYAAFGNTGQIAPLFRSVNDRISALEKLANSTSTEYQQSDSSKAISATINTLIIVLCTGAMTSSAADANPTSRDEAEQLAQRVSQQLDGALVVVGDRADDELYNALLSIRTAFISTMMARSSGLSDLMQVTMAQPIPALTLANRLYQDASRADELIQEARVPHPAFMPLTMKVLRQ